MCVCVCVCVYNEIIIKVILYWTPTYERAIVGRLVKTYILSPSANTGCSLEDLPRAMDDWDEW